MKYAAKFVTGLVLLLPVSLSAETLRVDGQPEYDLAPCSAVLEDPTGSISLADIRAGTTEFPPPGKRSPNLGISDSTFWLKCPVSHTADHENEYLLEIAWSSIDHLEVYAFGQTYGPMGRRYPLAARPIHHRHFVVPLSLPANAEGEILLRVRSEEVIALPLRLVRGDLLAREDRITHIAYGLFFGVLVAMLLYNLFLYASLRETPYLLYVLFMAMMIFYQLGFNGLLPLIFPEETEFNRFAFLVAVQLVKVIGIVFIGAFLEVHRRMPRMRRVMLALLLWELASIVLLTGGFGALVVVSNINTLVGIFLIFGLLLHQTVAGYTAARFMLVAWVALLAGYLILMLRNFGLVPANLFTHLAAMIGTALEALLLSLALADRINIMKRKLQTWGDELEQQVVDRTTRLRDALIDLSLKNEKIELELELAYDIQQEILPPPEAVSDAMELAAYCRYLEPVGGDYYDYFNLPGGSTGVLLADASGHGIPAALLTTMAKLSFLQSVRADDADPRRILLEVNEGISGLLQSNVYLTGVLLVFGPNGALTYSNAGHLPPLLYRRRADRLESLEARGVMLGTFANEAEMPIPLEVEQVKLEPGDRIFLYTDGMFDAWKEPRIFLGPDAVHDLFVETIDLPLAAARDRLHTRWTQAVMQDGFQDDSSFMLIEAR